MAMMSVEELDGSKTESHEGGQRYSNLAELVGKMGRWGGMKCQGAGGCLLIRQSGEARGRRGATGRHPHHWLACLQMTGLAPRVDESIAAMSFGKLRSH
jgi:hypothetical protein